MFWSRIDMPQPNAPPRKLINNVQVSFLNIAFVYRPPKGVSPSPSYNNSTTRPSLKPKDGVGAGVELKIRNSMSISTELLWAVWTPWYLRLAHPRGNFQTIPECSVVEPKIFLSWSRKSKWRPRIQIVA
jgi:hypothetical protein